MLPKRKQKIFFVFLSNYRNTYGSMEKKFSWKHVFEFF